VASRQTFAQKKVGPIEESLLRFLKDGAKIEDKLAMKTQDYSITELFVALAVSDSCNPGDVKHLLKDSETDFYVWITTEESVDVIHLLAEFLRRFARQNEDEKSVVDNVQRALKRVKDRSEIDRRRVEELIEDKKRN